MLVKRKKMKPLKINSLTHSLTLVGNQIANGGLESNSYTNSHKEVD